MNNKPTVAISTDFLTAYAALPRQKQGKVTEFFNKFRNDHWWVDRRYDCYNQNYQYSYGNNKIDIGNFWT